MSVLRPFVLVLSLSAVAFAQLDSNSVTVTASRSTNSPADQVIFGIFVDSDFTKSLSDIVSALSGVGITQANFSSLAQSSNPKQGLEWGFGLVAPLAKLKDTVTALTNLQTSISQNNPGLTMSFSVSGTQSSQTTPCSIPGLLSDANAQAQLYATGAGRTLGGILAMSTVVSTTVPGTGFPTAIYAYTSIAGSSGSPCSVTVKYALGN